MVEREDVNTVHREFGSASFQLTYADCDPAGIVYFASWFPWMERILTGWLFDQNLPSDQILEQHGFATITRQAECEYLEPAALFDKITMSMVSAVFGRTSIQWRFDIVRSTDGALVGRGKITLVIIDRGGKATPVPEVLRQKIQAVT